MEGTWETPNFKVRSFHILATRFVWRWRVPQCLAAAGPFPLSFYEALSPNGCVFCWGYMSWCWYKGNTRGNCSLCGSPILPHTEVHPILTASGTGSKNSSLSWNMCFATGIPDLHCTIWWLVCLCVHLFTPHIDPSLKLQDGYMSLLQFSFPSFAGPAGSATNFTTTYPFAKGFLYRKN